MCNDCTVVHKHLGTKAHKHLNTRHSHNPLQALRGSLGKLGVITRVQLRITREVPVRRSLSSLAPPAFLAQMNQLQATARAAAAARVNMSDTAALLAALPPWANETEWFWVPQARVLELACSLLPALHALQRLAGAASGT